MTSRQSRAQGRRHARSPERLGPPSPGRLVRGGTPGRRHLAGPPLRGPRWRSPAPAERQRRSGAGGGHAGDRGPRGARGRDRRQAVGHFEPAEGRDEIEVHQVEIDEELYLFPSDMLPYLSEDRLDRALFNIDALVAEGYDDASLDAVPLIATTTGGARSLSALTAADQGEPLESIDGSALSVDKDEASAFWESVTGAGRSRLAAGVQKIWLDGKVTARRSSTASPQIGAPDRLGGRVRRRRRRRSRCSTPASTPTHPDLAGQVAARRRTSPRAGRVQDRLRPRHPRRVHDRRHRRRRPAASARASRPARDLLDRQGARRRRLRLGVLASSRAWSGPPHAGRRRSST